MSEWTYNSLDDQDLLKRIDGHIIQPLLAAPKHTINATTKTIELVGSRSKLEVDRIKKLTKSIVDAEEREKTYGSGGEWQKWVHDHVLRINGVPFIQDVLRNLPSAITVALVYIPLSISLAIASDASPSMGLTTAVWAMISAGLLGGSHHNIVGPTGALTGILSKASIRYGVAVLPLLAMISGVLCLVAFVARLDVLTQFIPMSVIQGFTVGIAFGIAANQLNFALGLPKLPRHEMLIDNILEQFNNIHLFEWQAFVMFLCFAITQFLLTTIFPKFRKIPIPWPVIMASIGIIIGFCSSLGAFPYRIRTLALRYPSFASASLIAVPQFGPDLFTPTCFTGSESGQASSAGSTLSNQSSAGPLHEPAASSTHDEPAPSQAANYSKRFTSTTPPRTTTAPGHGRRLLGYRAGRGRRGHDTQEVSFDAQWDQDLCRSPGAVFDACLNYFQTGLSVAFVAVLETLISAKIASQVTKTKFNQRKEVLSLGVASIIAGACGGFPPCASLAATPLNIKCGAKSRLSSIMASIFMTIILLALLPTFKFLPLPCVAAMLVNVAYRMLEFEELNHIWHQDKGQFALVIVVAIVSVLEDPTEGIVVGWIISMLKTCIFLSKAHAKVMVRQGTAIISLFYSELILSDKVLPPFMFKRVVEFKTPDAVQESFVFNPAFAPRSRRHHKEMDFNRQQLHSSASLPEDEDSWDEVKRLGVSVDDSAYNVVVHYVIMGQLGFITCGSHLRRLTRVPCELILLDLSDVSGVDIDGQIALEDMASELESAGKVIFLSGLGSQTDEVRDLVEHTKMFQRLQDQGRVIDTYVDSVELFLTREGEHVSQETMRMKRELLIDPRKRIDMFLSGCVPEMETLSQPGSMSCSESRASLGSGYESPTLSTTRTKKKKKSISKKTSKRKEARMEELSAPVPAEAVVDGLFVGQLAAEDNNPSGTISPEQV